MKIRRYILVVGLLAVLVLVIIGFQSRPKTAASELTITNLDSCSKDINSTSANSLDQQLYSLIQLANSYQELPSQSSYTATIREGSCSTKASGKGVSSSTAIIDIPVAKQSWKVTYSWVTGSATTDLGSITPACLAKSELRYGDFYCSDVLGDSSYVDNSDPITRFLPHSTLDYSLTLDNPNTTVLNAQLFLTAADEDNADAVTAQYKQEVLNYITSVGLNPGNYTINYTVIQN